MRMGSSGPEVQAFQKRLAELGYDPGPQDGRFGWSTMYATYTFQKAQGIKTSSVVDSATQSALAQPKPIPIAYASPPSHVEINIAGQYLVVVIDGQMAKVTTVSTGSGKLFTSEGWTRRAVTPNGAFSVGYKYRGLQQSPLGQLWNPVYFNGGIAIHGNSSVPNYPASHGCVRVPMYLSMWMYDHLPREMRVYVFGGPTGDNPQPEIANTPVVSPSPEPSDTSSPTDTPTPGPTSSPTPGPTEGPTPTPTEPPSPTPSPTSLPGP
jgi:peptidoglycan hydrolase-like protein with peptidoglycan-binding domain